MKNLKIGIKKQPAKLRRAFVRLCRNLRFQTGPDCLKTPN
nr:MAG TPA: hypothetical protein [Caudoviricetes sp.]